MLRRKLLLPPMPIVCCQMPQAQYLMDMVDTSKDMGKGLLALHHRFDNIKLTGYIQPQFQVAATKGELSSVGNFAANSNSRFMLKRARILIDYSHFPTAGNGASYHFVFHVDATERGVNVRDVWGQLLENKYKMFAFAIGLFA
jgi:hypothetical protein